MQLVSALPLTSVKLPVSGALAVLITFCSKERLGADFDAELGYHLAWMEKPAIYIETSVVSYLVARPSRDLIVAAHQQLTVEWWRTQRSNYDLFTSQIVIEEARAGDQETAEERLAVIEELPLLEVNEEVIHLAQELITSHAVPEKAARDALHIAVACLGAVDYLLTWNCKHIANAKARSFIEKTCRSAGFAAPIMCTPEELED